MGMVDASWTSQDADAAKRDTAKGWWRIVWCHERCHKQENEARCQAIRSDAEEVGASLVCLKKATQFTLWIKRTPRPPFALITDWREAQPCLQAVLQPVGAVSRPVFTVVLCESQRQLARATEWAQGLPPEAGSVLACDRSDIPAGLLHGIVRRHFSTTESVPCDAGPPGLTLGGSFAGAGGSFAGGGAMALVGGGGAGGADATPDGSESEEAPPGLANKASVGFNLEANADKDLNSNDGMPLPVKLYRKHDGALAIRTYSDDWDVSGGYCGAYIGM